MLTVVFYLSCSIVLDIQKGRESLLGRYIHCRSTAEHPRQKESSDEFRWSSLVGQQDYCAHLGASRTRSCCLRCGSVDLMKHLEKLQQQV